MSNFLSRGGDHPAVIFGGRSVTYRELDDTSSRLAEVFRAAGLTKGDRVAVLLENGHQWFEVLWAALRSGLYIVPINWHLRADEVQYVIEDSGARGVVTSADLAALVPNIDSLGVRLVVGGHAEGFDEYETRLLAASRFDGDETEGAFMFYSSGTTGRPKGIKPELAGVPFGEGGGAFVNLLDTLYEIGADTVYLSPAPLYHAAPIGWSASVHRTGGTVVVMERFDPEEVLRLVDEHHVTHAQFVPTHFIRMLQLPDEIRHRSALPSLRYAVHAAAPCPVPVKRQMIEWWGPRIYEYYGGSEAIGLVAIGPEESLGHPGSVGRPVFGTLHLLDDDGHEVPVGAAGQIWFESPVTFEYHNDPVKTAGAFNDRGWSSLGDIGRVDTDGYLYLTDRTSHMIISGGVNIYPQEVENELTMHPAVSDVAVIGVPNPEFGEEVKAVVVAADPSAAGPALGQELLAFCRSRLASFKCPRSVDFVESLPRLPTGKLLKRELRERYVNPTDDVEDTGATS